MPLSILNNHSGIDCPLADSGILCCTALIRKVNTFRCNVPSGSHGTIFHQFRRFKYQHNPPKRSTRVQALNFSSFGPTRLTQGVDTYTYKNRQSFRSTHRNTLVQSRLPQQLPLHRPSYCCRALFRQCSRTSVHCSVTDRVDWQELTQGITWSTSRRYLAWWHLRPSPPAAMPCHCVTCLTHAIMRWRHPL